MQRSGGLFGLEFAVHVVDSHPKHGAELFEGDAHVAGERSFDGLANMLI
jgi:hypothetical protein